MDMVPIKLQRMDDIISTFDPSLFIPMSTKRSIDRFFSYDVGLMPATNTMISGDPGVGKSTVFLEYIAQLHKQGKRVLYVSAEMTSIDLKNYVHRIPEIGQVKMLFLHDYLVRDVSVKEVLEKTFNVGWDVIMLDSLAEIFEALSSQETGYTSKKKMQTWLLNILQHHNKGANDRQLYTAFLLIQQVRKDGTFLGSNRIKHLITSSVELRWDDEGNGGRYLIFTKNRRGGNMNRLYYNLPTSGGIKFLHEQADNED